MANSGSNKVWSVVSLGTMHNRGSAVWKPTVPGTPTFVNPEGGETIYFAPSANGGSAITNWYASISPDGPTLTLDTPDPENGGSVTISNYEWDTTYMLSVWAENEVGEGPPSVLPVEFVAVWNEATGGDITIDHDYNGSGESWKIHTFTGDGTFNVTSESQDFKLLLVGGGVGGGPGGWDWSGAGGRGGRLLETTGQLPIGDNDVVIGGHSDKPSTVGSFSSATGAVGGAGGGPASGPNGYERGENGSQGRSSNISGSTVWYVGGGGSGGPKHKTNSSGDWNWGGDGGSGGNRGGGGGSRGTGSGANANGWPVGNGGAGAANTGGGGGGGGEREGSEQGGSGGGNGGTGIVIIAYRIG